MPHGLGAVRRVARGRPRSAELDATIVATAIELLGEVGMAGLSMDLLARRAGVGKATIYRRWDSKEQLVIDALMSSVAALPVSATGSARTDIEAYVHALVERFGEGRLSDVLPHLIEASCYDDDLRELLEHFTRQRQSTLRGLLQRGIEGGEIDEGIDVDMVVDSVIGSVVYRRLMSGAPLDAAFADRLLTFVFAAAGLPTIV